MLEVGINGIQSMLMATTAAAVIFASTNGAAAQPQDIIAYTELVGSDFSKGIDHFNVIRGKYSDELAQDIIFRDYLRYQVAPLVREIDDFYKRSENFTAIPIHGLAQGFSIVTPHYSIIRIPNIRGFSGRENILIGSSLSTSPYPRTHIQILDVKKRECEVLLGGQSYIKRHLDPLMRTSLLSISAGPQIRKEVPSDELLQKSSTFPSKVHHDDLCTSQINTVEFVFETRTENLLEVQTGVHEAASKVSGEILVQSSSVHPYERSDVIAAALNQLRMSTSSDEAVTQNPFGGLTKSFEGPVPNVDQVYMTNVPAWACLEVARNADQSYLEDKGLVIEVAVGGQSAWGNLAPVLTDLTWTPYFVALGSLNKDPIKQAEQVGQMGADPRLAEAYCTGEFNTFRWSIYRGNLKK